MQNNTNINQLPVSSLNQVPLNELLSYLERCPHNLGSAIMLHLLNADQPRLRH